MTGDSSGNSTETVSGNDMPILNACLSFIRYTMISRDKLYIQDATCARFDIASIKNAHKVLHIFCDPTEKYTYKGPNKSSMREKSIHAFEQIYDKLKFLDARGQTPTIACPSDELHSILSMNGHCDHKVMEIRFQKVEDDVSDLKSMEKTVEDLKRSVLALMSGTSPMYSASAAAMSAISPSTRDRVMGNSVGLVTTTRARSPSVASSKRNRSESDGSSDNSDLDFKVPKYHEKRVVRRDKKLKTSGDPKSYATSLKSGTPKSSLNRRPANWGKSSEASCSGFAGAVPDAFLFNCAGNPTEQQVRDHLVSKKISVVNIKLKSGVEAYRRSFQVSLLTHTDYDNLLSGEFLPRGVGVKKFIHPKYVGQSWASNRPAFVKHPSSDKVTADVNGFFKLSEIESDLLLRKNVITPSVVTIINSDGVSSDSVINSATTIIPDSVSNNTLINSNVNSGQDNINYG